MVRIGNEGCLRGIDVLLRVFLLKGDLLVADEITGQGTPLRNGGVENRPKTPDGALNARVQTATLGAAICLNRGCAMEFRECHFDAKDRDHALQSALKLRSERVG